MRARLAAIILLALLPAFLLLVVVASLERTRAANTAAAEQRALARLSRSQYMELISATEQLMAWAALFPEVRTGDGAACTQRLAQLYDSLEGYRGLSVSTMDGTSNCVVAESAITSSLQVGERDFFRNAVAKKRFAAGGMEIDAISGRPNINFGMPILGDDGQMTRVLGAALDVDTLNRRLTGIDVPADAVLILTDADGQVILRSEQPQAYIGRSFPLQELMQGKRASEGVASVAGLDGLERQYAWSTIELNGEDAFYAIVGYTEERIYGGIDRTLLASLIGLALVALVALVASWLSAETMIVRRIDQLVKVANRMREGDLQVRTGMRHDSGEFGQLAATLDSLAASLETRNQENEQLIAEMSALNVGLEQRVVVRTQQLQTSNARLLESQAELRRLSRQLMQATEQERTRISREIHDQVGQMITAIKMELSTLRRHVRTEESLANSSGGADIHAKIDDISELLDEAVILVRRISTDLRPELLDDFGLVAAVEGHLAEFEKRTGIHHTFSHTLDEDLLLPSTATAVFRIMQESLTNVMRHAQASEVNVRLATEDGELTLRVQDNGRGITAEEQTTRTSLGLLGMRERAAQLGGTLEIAGAMGSGTTLVLQLPLSQQTAGDSTATAARS